MTERRPHARVAGRLALGCALAIAGWALALAGCASSAPGAPVAFPARIGPAASGPAASGPAASGPAASARGGSGQAAKARGGGGPAATAPVREAPITRYGFPGSAILGAPTATSVTLSLLSSTALAVYVEYGAASARYTARTATTTLAPQLPGFVALTGLRPDAVTWYRIRYRASGSSTFSAANEQSFRTPRATGSAFSFAVEADPHVDVDGKMQPALFAAALANVRAERPDFLVDLGDTFLGDKFATSEAELTTQYANVRNDFGIIGPSVPLFLVNGNHEGEVGWRVAGSKASLATWAATERTTYYPLPKVGSVTGGAAATAASSGPGNYYAWEWGDALFLVLDPYSLIVTDPKQSGDAWDWTLGDAQYAWLARTLATSTARYRFVFTHHVLGDMRGGTEWAPYYEWGGGQKNGIHRFAIERPGWAMTIHDLFVRYGVTIVFQGHDHLYARQELDGVVYQTVPQPATDGDPANAPAYLTGTVLPAPGTLSVSVGATGVTVRYIRASVGANGSPAPANGSVVTSYVVSASAVRP